MRVLKAISPTIFELLKIVSPVFVVFVGLVLWTLIPELAQTVLGWGALVAVASVFGRWAWEILGASDEGYPFGRAGRLMHLLLAFGVVEFIALGFLAWVHRRRG